MEALGGHLAGANVKKIETLAVGNMQAASVLLADAMAWKCLESVLGGDPVKAWTLKAMQHSWGCDVTNTPYVEFLAEFVRDPEYDPAA